MIIHSYAKDYSADIHDTPDFLTPLLHRPNAYYVIDRKVLHLYPEFFRDISEDRLYIIDAVEDNKTIETALEICGKMTAIPAKRNAWLVSVGGGIVQDVTGFAACILYRGVNWAYVPTTLLSVCDSCIGSKTSLNYGTFKNLLGTFYPPNEIHIWSGFFKTLSPSDYCSGLGELAKFAVMQGEAGVEELSASMDALLNRDSVALGRFMKTSIDFKKQFIEQDEFDRGVRINLNFAHTFGHAIESASAYSVPHGSAVALGLIVANKVSVQRGLLTQATAKRIEPLILRLVPDGVSPWTDEVILSAIKKDKKQTGTGISAILLDSEFKLNIVNDLNENEVHEAFAYLQELLTKA